MDMNGEDIYAKRRLASVCLWPGNWSQKEGLAPFSIYAYLMHPIDLIFSHYEI